MRGRVDESGRLNFPTPAEQRISSARVLTIKNVAMVAAIGITIYDAYVSYTGFQLLDLPNHAPLVLALLIFVTQLASGAIQQLGMDPFRGVGGSKIMDFAWRWALVSVYVIDIGSNALSFKVADFTTWSTLSQAPVSALGEILLRTGLGALLTFGDEILMRLVDRLAVGSRSNEISGRKSQIELAAAHRYLNSYQKRAFAMATESADRAALELSWLKQHGVDD